MSIPRSFQALCDLPPKQRTSMGQKLLLRTIREEWPLVAHLRRRMSAAGLDHSRAIDLDGFRSLTPETLAKSLAQAPRDLCPQPDPGRIRQNWGWSRKLGLILARGKGGPLLQRGYQATLADPLEDALSGGRNKRVQSSEFDEELLAEQGSRCLELLGIKAGPLVLDPRAQFETLTRRALVGGARLQGLELRESAPPSDQLQGVHFTTRKALTAGALNPEGMQQPKLVLLDPINADQQGLLTLTAARLVLPVLGDGSGAVLWDDLVWVEEVWCEEGGVEQGRGKLAFTHLAQHGTMLARTVLDLPKAWGRLVPPTDTTPSFPRLTQLD
ncbi:MAG: hypothetical protein CMJ86_05130 [Planctomycetes bacterium]|nr:hypothetical protein [Planctomycetota bacterium]